jgi:uncharacterized protein HemX
MFSKIPALKLAEKAVAATVVCGALALGTGGVAFAATTGTGTTPRHHHCARAPKALAKITKAETALSNRIAKLQTAETKLTAAGHTTLATKVENRISKLQNLETKASTLESKIEAKCPPVSSS